MGALSPLGITLDADLGGGRSPRRDWLPRCWATARGVWERRWTGALRPCVAGAKALARGAGADAGADDGAGNDTISFIFESPEQVRHLTSCSGFN